MKKIPWRVGALGGFSAFLFLLSPASPQIPPSQVPAAPSEYRLIDRGWSSVSGNSSLKSGLLSLKTEEDEESAGISVTCPSSDVARTAKASWTFDIEWKPGRDGEKPPSKIKVELTRTSVLTAEGNGRCQIVDAKGAVLDDLNREDYFLSGYFTQLDPIFLTSPVKRNAAGKHVARFVVRSDTVKATRNSLTAKVSKAEEWFGVFTIEGLWATPTRPSALP